MTTIRVSHNKDNPYVMLSKIGLHDPNLSLKAKGLWAYMLSFPDNWEFNMSHLSKTLQEGRIAIANAMKELLKKRYMLKIQFTGRNEDGTYGFQKNITLVFEFPLNKEEQQSRFQEEISLNEGSLIQKKFTKACFVPTPFLTAQTPPVINKEENQVMKETTTRREVNESLPNGEDEKPPLLFSSTEKDKEENPKKSSKIRSANLPSNISTPLPLFHPRQKYLKGLSESEIRQVQLCYEKSRDRHEIENDGGWITQCVRGGWYKEELISDEDLQENFKFARKIEDNFNKYGFQGIDAYCVSDPNKLVLVSRGKPLPTPPYKLPQHRYKSLVITILKENYLNSEKLLR